MVLGRHKAIRTDGIVAAEHLALYTTALVASPEALLELQPSAESFQWVKRPAEDLACGTIYVDGSRIDA